MPRLDLNATQKLIDLYHAQRELRGEIEVESAQLAAKAGDDELSRYWLIMLPDDVARELLRQKFGSLTYEHSMRLLHFVRCARPGTLLELSAGRRFQATVRQLIFLGR